MTRPAVAIVGAGPAGLTAALGMHKVGYDVCLFDHCGEVRATGNILNLWPSPQKALVLRDVVFDHTPLLQWTRGNGVVKHACELLDEIKPLTPRTPARELEHA